MILADKIIQLRKKNGWSQEELAEKMGVSRQSVSKWESAQSVPDLNKILLMGDIFGVTTDYLLKDDKEEEEYLSKIADADVPKKRLVSMEEANEFLEVKKFTAPRIALATALCILSPITLIILGAGAECGVIPLTDNQAGAIGMIVLVALVAIAVFMYIMSGEKTRKYAFLDVEPIETEYGVSGMVREKQTRFRRIYVRNNVIGTCLCILSVVPLFLTIFIAEDDFIVVIGIGLLLVMIAMGVYFFITAGIVWASTEKLLQEGDYNIESKENAKMSERVGTVYWLIVTAIYLSVSFWTFEWHRTWIVWPVAGVLYGALIAVINIIRHNRKTD